jgi:threonine dehydrogenase-like Zn-dependent dehydrogenase
MSTVPSTMKAAVIERPGAARLIRAPVPRPGLTDVLVRIEGCGICASSLPLWEGRRWFSYPLEAGAPGHEGWGVVEAVGQHVEGLEKGQPVALLSPHAYAEYAAAPAAHCVAHSLAGPVPGEPLACAINVLSRSDVRPGQLVAIVGLGFLGSLIARLCERAGAEVVAVRRGVRIEATFERVIECAGTQEALDTAAELVGMRGRLVIAGYHQDGRRSIDLQSWNWRGIDVVNAHERDPAACVESMRAGIELIATGELDVRPLLTHRFPLARLGDAFECARTHPSGFLKAWVEP